MRTTSVMMYDGFGKECKRVSVDYGGPKSGEQKRLKAVISSNQLLHVRGPEGFPVFCFKCTLKHAHCCSQLCPGISQQSIIGIISFLFQPDPAYTDTPQDLRLPRIYPGPAARYDSLHR